MLDHITAHRNRARDGGAVAAVSAVAAVAPVCRIEVPGAALSSFEPAVAAVAAADAAVLAGVVAAGSSAVVPRRGRRRACARNGGAHAGPSGPIANPHSVIQDVASVLPFIAVVSRLPAVGIAGVIVPVLAEDVLAGAVFQDAADAVFFGFPCDDGIVADVFDDVEDAIHDALVSAGWVAGIGPA
jgi:hypothetical protein